MSIQARAAGAPAPPTTSTGTTVLIIDDHRSFADLLAAALEASGGMHVLAIASTADEGVGRAAELRPSLAVVDVQLGGEDGLTAARRIRTASPGTAVAVVTAHTTGEWVARAARAGASAFIPKDGTLAEMITLLREARPGPMRVARSARPAPQRGDGAPGALTARELEVLGYLSMGLEAKSIAKVMGISTNTCRGYLKTVYATLQVSSRIMAVNRARELDLVRV